MFFILSKVLVYLLFPFTWVLLLLVWHFASKQRVIKKRCLFTAIAVFLLFSNAWLLDAYASYWDAPPSPITAGQSYNCAIVLGGFVNADKQDNGYFNAAADRLLQAVALYHQGIVKHILISGGNGQLMPGNFKESNWAKQQMMKMGVPDTALLLEDKSRNTMENAQYSKQLLDAKGIEGPYLLVSSAYHMRRAKWIFDKVGLKTWPYPCNYVAGRGKMNPGDILPQIHVTDLWFIYIKELIGFEAYKLKMLTQGK